MPSARPLPAPDAGVLRVVRAQPTPLPPGPNAVPDPEAATVHPDTDESVKAVPGPGEALRSPAESAAPSRAAPAPKPPPPVAPPSAPRAAARAPEPPTLPASSEPQHGWAVQVGSFGVRTAAQRRADELNSNGFTAFVSPMKMGRHKVVYRVRAPAPDRDSALDLALQLRLAGYDVSLARPQ